MCKPSDKFIKNLIFIILIIIATLLFCLNFKIILVDGQSMAPTYKDKQILLTCRNKTPVLIEDVVVFKHDNDVCIKRVIATEGDVVTLKEGYVYVNKLKINASSYKGTEKQYILSEGEYFVMGDNYRNSSDSREYGPIVEEDIISVVVD